jgi:hypothetical protein
MLPKGGLLTHVILLPKEIRDKVTRSRSLNNEHGREKGVRATNVWALWASEETAEEGGVDRRSDGEHRVSSEGGDTANEVATKREEREDEPGTCGNVW